MRKRKVATGPNFGLGTMYEIEVAQRMQGMSGNVVREILKLTQQGSVLSFAGGLPSPDSFPNTAIQEIANEVLASKGTSILQYATTEGYPPLREAIASWVKDFGIEATADNVAILSGSQQGLDLVCKAFINPGDAVIVERPTYLSFLDMLKMYEARPIHVPADDEGMDPELLEAAIQEHKPRVIYLIPTFRNPTGECMSARRRKEIVEIAARHRLVIVEDDAYGRLRYDGDHIPAVASFGYPGALYLGSFSKIVAPGLRIGYAIGDAQLLRTLVIAKQGADLHSSNLSQAIIAEFFARNLLGEHIRRISQVYVTKRDTIIEAIEEFFPTGSKVTHPDGGLFVWATVPEPLSTSRLLEKAIKERVAYIPGTPFYRDGGGDTSMRLNFSNASLEELRWGMKQLGGVLTEALTKVN